ncbi:DUF2207 domain-containing protein [Virgibacillus oceani]
MKKLISALMIMLSLFILAACSDEDRSFSIDEVNIDAHIDEEGTIQVRELFTYTFHGSFEGMTRSIDSDVNHFEAYLTEGNAAASSNELVALEVEEEDGTYSIFSASTDETKQVLYTYDVEGSVEKYADVADITYAFFDDSNETDLHNVTIEITTPSGNMTNTHYFLHEDETGELTVSGSSLVYNNALLEAGETSSIRFVFPSDQLTGMELDKEEAMEAEILAAERELAEREANLEENMGKAVPILRVLIGAVLLSAIILFMVHPNRYRGNKSEDHLLRLLEETDPLFVQYVSGYATHLPNESFIAGLFSLKQRGIIKLQEVPSFINEEENTFRFTWVKEAAEVDMADNYLRSWLFTEKDQGGDYFLLDTLLDNENESEDVKKEKAEEFDARFTEWAGLVKEREDYQGLQKTFRGFSLFSIPTLIITFGLFYYFTTIDTISQTEQWVLPAITGVLTMISLVFNRNKWVIIPYYFIAILMTAVGFTLTPAVILTLILFGISGLALLIIPSTYWNKDMRKLNFAIRTADRMFKEGRYPIGSNQNKIERRLEYAIILDRGESYGEQCGKEEQVSSWDKMYPLLSNPVYAATSFSASNLALYTTVVHSTSNTSSNPSATGGGGAGAF